MYHEDQEDASKDNESLKCYMSIGYWKCTESKRDDRLPDSHEGESKKKSENPSKFSQERLPGVDQLL